jgi:hypothetical protein
MYEKRHQPLLPWGGFLRRMFRHVMAATLVIGVSLLIGVVGYHESAGLGWVDSLLNAAMILTGMGPVAHLPSDASKIFASLYALYSGVAFLSAVGVLFVPVMHRILHHFHLALDDEQPTPAADG